MDSEHYPVHAWKRLVCWYDEHVWVDDGFMGSGLRCARCGAWNDDLKTGDETEVIAFLAGVFVGVLLASTVLLWVIA